MKKNGNGNIANGFFQKFSGEIPGGLKNENLENSMTFENGYPQQGGYEKFLEKPNTNTCTGNIFEEARKVSTYFMFYIV